MTRKKLVRGVVVISDPGRLKHFLKHDQLAVATARPEAILEELYPGRIMFIAKNGTCSPAQSVKSFADPRILNEAWLRRVLGTDTKSVEITVSGQMEEDGQIVNASAEVRQKGTRKPAYLKGRDAKVIWLMAMKHRYGEAVSAAELAHIYAIEAGTGSRVYEKVHALRRRCKPLQKVIGRKDQDGYRFDPSVVLVGLDVIEHPYTLTFGDGVMVRLSGKRNKEREFVDEQYFLLLVMATRRKNKENPIVSAAEVCEIFDTETRVTPTRTVSVPGSTCVA